MSEIHILGIHQDPDETPTPLWQRMFAVADGDMTKFFPMERFLSRELVWVISQRDWNPRLFMLPPVPDGRHHEFLRFSLLRVCRP